MGQMYFVYFPSINATTAINWTAIGVLVSSCPSLITMIGLIKTWMKINSDNEEKSSLFYLEQIKSYFANATALLKESKNNNIKWHQAIESLKTGVSLGHFLKNKAHQNIYVVDYLDAAYCIIDVISSIDDLRFFYGISDYLGRDSLDLYQESNPNSFDKAHFRIAPEALWCLVRFIDKANRVFYDVNYKKTPRATVFDSTYFQTPIDENTPISAFTESNMMVVIAYIENFASNKTEVEKHTLSIAECA